MLIDTDITIAYKCSFCGSFEFFNTSLFMLMLNKECTYKCHCGKSGITIERDNFSRYNVKIPCIACGNNHSSTISRRNLMNKETTTFNCPDTGIKQCFLGKDKIVHRLVDSLEKELDELIDMFGYDNYFKNTQVMFDLVNRVHDLAEQGKLYCECGNKDIELVLLSDKIYLKCKKCYGSKIINAVSNLDIREVLDKQRILLPGNSPAEK